MDETLKTRIRAATDALGPLIERQAEGVPWHYGIQIVALRKRHAQIIADLNEDPAHAELLNLDDLAQGIETPIPWKPGQQEYLIYIHLAGILGDLSDILDRMIHGPTAKPEIAEAATELVPLVEDLTVALYEAEPDWHRVARENGTEPDPPFVIATPEDLTVRKVGP